jgi:ATP-dependent helicase/nuclease subunit A
VTPLGSTRLRLQLSSPATAGTVLRLESLAQTVPGGAEDTAAIAAAAGENGSDAGPGAQLSFLAEGAPSSIPEAPQIDHMATDAPTDEHPPVGAFAPSRRAVGARRATPPGERLATLSYTSLSELERCGYRYYLERVLGLAEERSTARTDAERGGVEARARGTLIHRLMESLDFARPRVPSAEQVASLASELGLRVGRGEREEIVGLIAAATNAELAARVAGAQGVWLEHPFAFSIAGSQPLVTGVIDLLAHERDGDFVVLDYKSDRVGPTLDLSALVEREYAIQRLLYALAVLRGGAAQVEVVHWFLERPHEPVIVRFRREQRDALEQRLAAHVSGARERGFGVSSSPHRGLCLTCPGRAGLCSWGEQETMREQPALEQLFGGSLEDRR